MSCCPGPRWVCMCIINQTTAFSADCQKSKTFRLRTGIRNSSKWRPNDSNYVSLSESQHPSCTLARWKRVRPEVANLSEAFISMQPLYVLLKTWKCLEANSYSQVTADTPLVKISHIFWNRTLARGKGSSGVCHWEKKNREAVQVKHREEFWKANWALTPRGDCGEMKCS